MISPLFRKVFRLIQNEFFLRGRGLLYGKVSYPRQALRQFRSVLNKWYKRLPDYKIKQMRLEDYDGSFWFYQRNGYAKAGGAEETGFYKADSDSKKQLERLQQLYATAPDRVKPQIERDMKLLAYGIAGEENVAFELNNSYLPIIVLHNLRLEHEGLSVQIDYLIITTKFCLVVECKNLFRGILKSIAVGNLSAN